MAKGCECGKAESCDRSHHPNTQMQRRFTQATPVLHMQRRPGETFAQLRKRLAGETTAEMLERLAMGAK